MKSSHLVALGLSLWSTAVSADVVADVQWDDSKSVKKAAASVAFGLAKFYTGNNTGDTPGNLPDPYYWWEAGAMFGTFIDYWWLTGDDSYNTITSQALIHQGGTAQDFMPENQTRTEGNDDQGFWAMAAMSAAEHKFPNPPDSTDVSWLALAQAVFNQYVSRWDTDNCDGGLRWQIFQFNNGYDYKNSVSNGCFFNVAARLARYTGNKTYAQWAEKVYDWQHSANLMGDQGQVYDGARIAKDGSCKVIDKGEWTYNSGLFLHGSAVMYNYTEKDTWKQRTDLHLKWASQRFFKNKIAYEQWCEPSKRCDVDQESFKGYLIRWLAATIQMAPHTATQIKELFKASSAGAVKVCTGNPTDGTWRGPANTACGFAWTTGAYDGFHGLGPQMNALDMIMYMLIDDKTEAAVTNSTGGTSKGNPNAGTGDKTTKKDLKAITGGDRAGAGILTALFIASLLAGVAYVIQ